MILDRLLGRRWAKLGSRPVAVLDQRTASTYIFGAICPLHGKAVGLILPECNIEAMNLHLAEIAAAVAPGAHAVLILDQAGWHVSDQLIVQHDEFTAVAPPHDLNIHRAADPGQALLELRPLIARVRRNLSSGKLARFMMTWHERNVRRHDQLSGPEAMDRGAHHRVTEPLPTAGQRLGMPQQ